MLKTRLVELSKPGKEYQELLKLLIVQGLLKMSERKLLIRIRPEDEKLVEGVLKDAIADYKARSGRDVDATIDKKHYLPSGPSASNTGLTCSGGVLLTADDDKIICDNTLDQRLSLAFDAKIPDIRTTIFKGA